MINNIRKLKEFTIEEIGLIFFISSRVITWLFSQILGQSAVYLTMILFLAIYGVIAYKKIKNKETGLLSIFFIITFFVTAIALISATGNQFRRDWILSKEHGLIVKVFDPRKGIFGLFLILMIKDTKNIIRSLTFGSYFLLIYLVMQVFIFSISGSWESYYIIADDRSVRLGYNLNLGYEAAFCFLIFFYDYLKNRNRNKTSFILSILGLLLGINFGARGVLIICSAFMFLYFVFVTNNTKDRIQFFITCLVLIGITAILSFAYINMVSTIRSLGIGTDELNPKEEIEISRTIDSLLEGDISNDNGRIKLWNYSLDAIKDSPIFGNGLFGDRLYVGNTFKWGYSHNILLELVSSFGILGGLFFIALMYYLFKFLLDKELNEYKGLVIIFTAMCSKLLISDSFLFLDQFWMIIGIVIIGKFKNKKIKMAPLIASIMLAINFILLINYIRVDANRRAFKDFKPQGLVAVINIEGVDIEKYEKVLDNINTENIKGTFFIETNTLEENPSTNIDKLIESGWDIQDNFPNYKIWSSYSIDEVKTSLNESNAFFEKNSLSKPDILSTLSGGKNLKVMKEVITERKAFYNYTNSISGALKNYIDSDEFYELKGYRISNVSQSKYLRKKIDEYLLNNKEGVLILDFYEIYDSINDEGRITYSNINYLVSYLRDLGFEFKTMKEIVDESYIDLEDRTILEYIRNFDISYVLK